MATTSKPIPALCTFEELCEMPRDHRDIGDFCLMTDAETVWLSEQAMGEARKQHLEIPRDVFNTLLQWYLGRKDIAA